MPFAADSPYAIGNTIHFLVIFVHKHLHNPKKNRTFVPVLN